MTASKFKRNGIVIVWLTLIGIGFLLISCSKCDEKTVECPVLPKEYRSVFYQNITGDSIKFVTDSGRKMSFLINESTIAPYAILDCIKGVPMGCACPTCEDNSYGEYIGKTNDKSHPYNQNNPQKVFYSSIHFKIQKSDFGVNLITTSFSVLDASGYFDLSPLELDSNQAMLPSVTFGNTVFKDVIHHKVDTSYRSDLRNYFVSDIYLNQKKGIIAFYDLKYKSLFYLTISP